MVNGDRFFRHELWRNRTMLLHEAQHAMTQSLQFMDLQLTGPAVATDEGRERPGEVNRDSPTLSFAVEVQGNRLQRDTTSL